MTEKELKKLLADCKPVPVPPEVAARIRKNVLAAIKK